MPSEQSDSLHYEVVFESYNEGFLDPCRWEVKLLCNGRQVSWDFCGSKWGGRRWARARMRRDLSARTGAEANRETLARVPLEPSDRKVLRSLRERYARDELTMEEFEAGIGRLLERDA